MDGNGQQWTWERLRWKTFSYVRVVRIWHSELILSCIFAQPWQILRAFYFSEKVSPSPIPLEEFLLYTTAARLIAKFCHLERKTLVLYD